MWGDAPEGDPTYEAKQKRTREKFLGPDLIAGLPHRYDEINAIHEIGYLNWNAMVLKERGEYIAYRRIKNMTEFCREYITFNDNLLKEELAAKKKGKKPNLIG